MTDELARMAEVTEALYLREYRQIAALLDEERRLRGQLARLDGQVAEANATLAGGAAAMQAMGAEVLWQAWAGRSRRQLNIELAAVRSRKLAAMDGLRRAFGRQEAVAAMREDDRQARARARAHALQQRLLRDL